MRKIIFLLIIFSIFANNTTAQYNYRSPLDIPLVLSANFGELRAHHFHSGIDFKTQGTVNKNVYAIEDGYISRIGVNAGGYGLVLYIDHPNGQTSVYAHLNSFAPKIAKFVKEEQYKNELYTIDVSNLDSTLLPIKRGELIALSGNTGSSGGPHVHFEIRDTKTETPLDPLPYYMDKITDQVKPEIKGLAVYPYSGHGVVNVSSNPYRISITALNKPNRKPIEAWGQIGIGIYAIDRMTGTNNIYGVRQVKLFCDDENIFTTEISSINFATTRMINSFVDYDYWRRNKQFYMKSFIEPGNKLQIYGDEKEGIININEERTYNLRYELEDLYGNKTVLKFNIEGKKQDIPQPEACSLVLHWDKPNQYTSDDFTLAIPPYSLYKDVNFLLKHKENQTYYSKSYKVHHSYEPLHTNADITIAISSDTLFNKSQYGVVSINEKGKESWVGGTYFDGYLKANIRELGNTYAVSADTVAPKITPVNPINWIKNKKIVIRLSDDKSGIKNFRGTINGEYVLFEHDIKSPNYTYRFDPQRLEKGSNHFLEFVATDYAGNTSEFEYKFEY